MSGGGGAGSPARSPHGDRPPGRFPFTRWLLQHRKETTALGDLARQVARDTEWTDPSSLAGMESQLLGAGSSQAVLEVARRAWRRYTADAGPRPRS